MAATTAADNLCERLIECDVDTIDGVIESLRETTRAYLPGE